MILWWIVIPAVGTFLIANWLLGFSVAVSVLAELGAALISLIVLAHREGARQRERQR